MAETDEHCRYGGRCHVRCRSTVVVTPSRWRCRVWSCRGRNDGQLRGVRHVRYIGTSRPPTLYETVRKFSLSRDDEQRRRVLPPACRHAIRHAVSRRSHDSQNVWTWHRNAPFSTSRRKPHRCHARCRLLTLPLLLCCWYLYIQYIYIYIYNITDREW